MLDDHEEDLMEKKNNSNHSSQMLQYWLKKNACDKDRPDVAGELI